MSMSKGSFFDKSKYVFYRFLIFSFLQKLFRGFHTFDKLCVYIYIYIYIYTVFQTKVVWVETTRKRVTLI